jgi:hypothetical protein
MALPKAKREIAIFLPVFFVNFHFWATLLHYSSWDLGDLDDFYYLSDFTSGLISKLLASIIATGAAYLYYRLIRWVASTAEKSGRSYAGFMILAIFFPVIAAVIVLIFKKDPP